MRNFIDGKELRLAVALMLSLGIIGGAAAEDRIHLKSRIIDAGNISFPNTSADSEERGHYLVQFDHLLNAKEKQNWKESGVDFLAYVPEKAWYASFPASMTATVASNPEVRMVEEIRPADSISPSILKNGLSSRSIRNGSAIVIVNFFEDLSRQDVEDILGKHGTALAKEGEKRWRISIDLSGDLVEKVRDLGGEDGVKWVEEIPPEPTTSLDDSRQLIEVDHLQSLSYNLTGEGFTAAESDGGWAGKHEDLNYSGKLVIGDQGCGESACSVDDHPTHVAGIMLGNGTVDNTYRGMAPDARLISYEWPDSSTSEVYDETDDALTYGSLLSQNSWGWNIVDPADMGDYGSWSRAYDDIISGEASSVSGTLSVIFSAGNEGNDWSFKYNTTSGVGATSKNTITVGAADDTGEILYFSSWGPTDDGRIKPDVVANGGGVYSTMPQGSGSYPYGYKSGTSMAAPAVSGLVILLNQDFNQSFGRTPSPATVKAILIQTADEMNRTGPDYISGWGMVNGRKAVNYVEEAGKRNLVKKGALDQGAEDNYSYSLDSGNASLTLVWSDYPGQTTASKALVNDLDLVVKNSTGHRFYPWTLDWAGRKETARRDREDHTNNVEQVRVPPGDYNITVEGYNIPEPDQNYTLLIDSNMTVESAPEITVESPLNTTYRGDPGFNITVDRAVQGAYLTFSSQNYSMVNSSLTEFHNTTVEVSEGFHQVTFYVNYTDGLISEKVRFSVDRTSPVLTVDSPENTTHTSTPDFNFSLDEAASWTKLSVDGKERLLSNDSLSRYFNTSISLSDGLHNATFEVNDTVDNLNSTTVYFSIDTTAPDIELVKPLNTTYGTVDVLPLEFTGNASRTWYRVDAGETTFISGNTTFNVTGEGIHNLTLGFNDSLGNEDSITRSFSVDTTPPTVSLNTPRDVNYSSSPDVNVSAPANITVLLSVNGTLNITTAFQGGYWLNTSYSFAEGLNEVRAFAVDSLNNTNATPNRPFWKDSRPPVIDVVSPLNQTYDTELTSFNITSSEALAEAKHSVDSGGNRTLRESGSFYQNSSKLGEGTHHVTFYVEDPTGNTNSTGVYFSVDNLTHVSLNAPLGNYSIRNVTVNATADEAASKVYATVNSSLNLTMVKSGGYWLNTTYSFAIGNNSLEVTARDGFGNTNSTTSTFSVDTTTPGIEVTSPLKDSYEEGDIWFNVTLTEPVKSVELGVDSTSHSLQKQNGTLFGRKLDMGEGDYNASFNATDFAGNWNVTWEGFKVEAPEEDTGGSSGGSGGSDGSDNSGGGGGGGLYLPPEEPEIEETDRGVKISGIKTSDGKNEVEIESRNTPVSSVSVGGDPDEEFSLTIENLTKQEREAYQWEELEFNSMLNVTVNGTTDHVNLSFRVPKRWLERKDYRVENISLYRLSGVRTELPTRLETELDDAYIYRARVDHFSVFGIAVPRMKSCKGPVNASSGDSCLRFPTSCDVPDSWEVVDRCEQEPEPQETTTNETLQETSADEGSGGGILGIALVGPVAAAVAMLGLLSVMRREQRKKLEHDMAVLSTRLAHKVREDEQIARQELMMEMGKVERAIEKGYYWKARKIIDKVKKLV